MSVKNGLAISITTMPIERLRPARNWRADSLRTQPSLAIASSTRCRVASETTAGELTTFDTVPTETPARAATSLTLTDDFDNATGTRLLSLSSDRRIPTATAIEPMSGAWAS